MARCASERTGEYRPCSLRYPGRSEPYPCCAISLLHVAPFRAIGKIEMHMVKRKSKSQPTWTDVKAKLAVFDRAGLLGLVQGLYAAHKDNQAFLHARLGLGEDVVEPYKQTLDRWL
jgi:hypothetical protein